MGPITTIFSDIGGVILTNGWDRNTRHEAVRVFGLDLEDFEDRHDLTFPALDSGQITLHQYLDRTVFYRARAFTREEFTAFMLAQSKEYPEARAVLDGVAASQKYFVGAINNEPQELNEYRIRTFELKRNFRVFFSSCYVNTRKPDEAIYRFALQVTQRQPEECVFIDDRPMNLESPRRLGMNVVHYQNPKQFRAELGKLGVDSART